MKTHLMFNSLSQLLRFACILTLLHVSNLQAQTLPKGSQQRVYSEVSCEALRPLVDGITQIIENRSIAVRNYRECRVKADAYTNEYGYLWTLAPYFPEFCSDFREQSHLSYDWLGDPQQGGCGYTYPLATPARYSTLALVNYNFPDGEIQRRLFPNPEYCISCLLAVSADGRPYAYEAFTTYPMFFSLYQQYIFSNPLQFHYEGFILRDPSGQFTTYTSTAIDPICHMQANACLWAHEDFELMKQAIRIAEALHCQIGDGHMVGIDFAERAIANAQAMMHSLTCTY